MQKKWPRFFFIVVIMRDIDIEAECISDRSLLSPGAVTLQAICNSQEHLVFSDRFVDTGQTRVTKCFVDVLVLCSGSQQIHM